MKYTLKVLVIRILMNFYVEHATARVCSSEIISHTFSKKLSEARLLSETTKSVSVGRVTVTSNESNCKITLTQCALAIFKVVYQKPVIDDTYLCLRQKYAKYVLHTNYCEMNVDFSGFKNIAGWYAVYGHVRSSAANSVSVTVCGFFKVKISKTTHIGFNSETCIQRIRYCSRHDVPPKLNIVCIQCPPKVNPRKNVSFLVTCVNCRVKEKLISSEGWVSLLDSNGKVSTNISSSYVTIHEKVNEMLLTVESKGLIGGKKYEAHINVIRNDNKSGTTKHSFTVNKSPKAGKCTLIPKTGITFSTLFNLTCTGFIDEDTPMIYEVSVLKPRTENHIGFPLEHIVSNKDYFSTKFHLPVGIKASSYHQIINSRAVDKYGAFTDVQTTVMIQPLPSGNVFHILDRSERILQKSRKNIFQKRFDGVDNEVFLVVDNLAAIELGTNISSSTRKEIYKRKLKLQEEYIQIISELPVTDLIKTFKVSFLLDYTSEIFNNVSYTNLEVIKSIYGKLSRTLSSKAEIKLIEKMENTVNLMFSGAVNLLNHFTDRGKKMIKYYPDYLPGAATNGSLEKIAKSANELIKAVKDATKSLLKVWNNTEITKEIGKESAVLILKRTFSLDLCKKDYFNNATMKGIEIMSRFSCSNSFIQRTFKMDNNHALDILIIILKENPYIWHVTARYVTSVVTDIEIIRNNSVISSRDFKTLSKKKPVTIYFSNLNTVEKNISSYDKYLNITFNYVVNGSWLIPNVTAHSSNLSLLNMTVIPGRTIVLEASIKETPIQLRFLFQDVKPHIMDLVNGTILADEKSARSKQETAEKFSVFLPPRENLKKKKTYYLGIAPFKNYSKDTINGSSVSGCIDDGCTGYITVMIYLHISTVTCLYWNLETEVWESSGCEVSPLSTFDTIVCWCYHMTVFSGSIFVLPNKVHPINDIVLFLEFYTNLVILCSMLTLWITYIIFLIWARRADQRDMVIINAGVTILLDNNPDDTYLYLICISTGLWKTARTTANIFIQCYGSDDVSVVHALVDTEKPCFRSGENDWFLMATPVSLGDIDSIQLWHDNTGTDPSWYLNQVTIEDMKTKKKWYFVYDNWLSEKKTLNITLHPDADNKLLAWKKYRFWQNFTDDLRNEHIWVSVFYKNVYSSFTRAQRLTCAFCLLLTYMLADIMFHGIPTDDPADQYRLGIFKVSLSEFVIGIESALIMFPITIIVVKTFSMVKPVPTGIIPWWRKLSFKKKNSKGSLPMSTRMVDEQNSSYAEISSYAITELRSEMLNVEQSKLEKNPTRLPWQCSRVAWAISILTAIISTYFILLYGLKYGQHKSLKWLISFMTSFCSEAIIMDPLKVIFFSILVTLILQKPLKYYHPVEGERHLCTNENYLHKYIYLKLMQYAAEGRLGRRKTVISPPELDETQETKKE